MEFEDSDVVMRYKKLRDYAAELTKTYKTSVDIRCIEDPDNKKASVFIVFDPATNISQHTCKDVFELTGYMEALGHGKLVFDKNEW